jgi:molybdate transport system ATP-binding protein
MEVDLQKNLGRFKLEVSFKTEKSSLGILGASGSGKSMTLKCIAGIVLPDAGRICVNGQVLFDSAQKINVKPQKRKVGYLFQDYALFPNFTTYQNIASGLNAPKHQKKEIIQELIERFQLAGLENQYPHQLSGGQQQRTALARIVASEPNVILLDEPFAALDSYLREQMQMETSKILKNYDNSIMVTHSRDEVYKLCSDLLVMDEGKVIKMGKTQELFKNPQIMQAAKLTGCKNISRIKRVSDFEICALDWGKAILRVSQPIDETIRFVGIRAHEIMPIFSDNGKFDNLIKIRIVNQSQTPFEKQIIFKKAAAPDFNNQAELWLEYNKDAIPVLPQILRMPPENLLLLT